MHVNWWFTVVRCCDPKVHSALQFTVITWKPLINYPTEQNIGGLKHTLGWRIESVDNCCCYTCFNLQADSYYTSSLYKIYLLAKYEKKIKQFTLDIHAILSNLLTTFFFYEILLHMTIIYLAFFCFAFLYYWTCHKALWRILLFSLLEQSWFHQLAYKNNPSFHMVVTYFCVHRIIKKKWTKKRNLLLSLF